VIALNITLTTYYLIHEQQPFQNGGRLNLNMWGNFEPIGELG
jgi:hypothetical protein